MKSKGAERSDFWKNKRLNEMKDEMKKNKRLNGMKKIKDEIKKSGAKRSEF